MSIEQEHTYITDTPLNQSCGALSGNTSNTELQATMLSSFSWVPPKKNHCKNNHNADHEEGVSEKLECTSSKRRTRRRKRRRSKSNTPEKPQGLKWTPPKHGRNKNCLVQPKDNEENPCSKPQKVEQQQNGDTMNGGAEIRIIVPTWLQQYHSSQRLLFGEMIH